MQAVGSLLSNCSNEEGVVEPYVLLWGAVGDDAEVTKQLSRELIRISLG